MQNDLTVGRVGSCIFRFTLPLLLGNVFLQVYQLVNFLIMGNVHNGDKMLAALGAVSPIRLLMLALTAGVGMGVSVLVSQYYGAKRTDELRRVAGSAFFLMLVLSVPMSVAGLWAAKQLLGVLQTPQEVVGYATDYLRIVFGGTAAAFGYHTVCALLGGIGDSKSSLYFIMVSSVVNTLLDILFMRVLKFGLNGSAWSAVITDILSFVMALWYLGRYPFFPRSFRMLLPDLTMLRKILQLGIPASLQQIAASAGMMLMQGRVNAFGSDIMAGFSTGGRVDNLVMMPVADFGTAMAAFAGQNIGAGKIKRIKSGLRAIMLMMTVFSVGFGMILYIWGEDMVGLFNSNPAVVAAGASYLRINAPFFVFGGAMMVLTGVMRGAGDAFASMIFSVCTLWVVRVPLTYVLSATPLLSGGIWLAQPVAWVTGTVISYFYYRLGRWKGKAVVGNK